MSIQECINQVREESTSIFEADVITKHHKTVTVKEFTGPYTDYEKLTKLLKREGYTVFS